MSNKQNDAFNEELQLVEEDYQDALEALEKAEEDFREAYDWKQSRTKRCDELAKRLQELKSQ